MAREYKKYKDYTKEERDRYIRLGERPFTTSKKSTTNIRPKDEKKGTTGTTVNTGAKRKPGGGTKGGSNLAKNLRPAPPPRFSRIQFPPNPANIKKKDEKKTEKKKKIETTEAIVPAVSRVIANKKPVPPKPKPQKKLPKPQKKLPKPQPKIDKISKLDIKTVQKENQKKVDKPKRIKPPKLPNRIKPPKIPRIPPKITIDLGGNKTKTKVLSKNDQSKIDKKLKNSRPRAGETNKQWLNRTIATVIGLARKHGTKALMFKSGVGAFLYTMRPKTVAAADDPEGDVKKAYEQKRKEIGTSMDYKRGGKVRTMRKGGKVSHYSHGRSIKRGLIKDVPNGNDFIARIYDN
jgi:hypothetical protein|tara:strand:+ start:5072 stop:6115 length:1044 start_codon:yes stop_codon:yes gene_type:complete